MGSDQQKDILGASDTLSQAFYDARRDELMERLKPRRFTHTLGVSRAAVRLAGLYDVDTRKARLAGLLHDWDKSYDDKGIRRRAEELGLVVDAHTFEEMPQILHGPTAAAALTRDYPAIPRDVIQAIARHTTGAIDMTDLDMIVYVADAIEPGRDYEGLDAIRALEGVVSLEELFVETFRYILLHLIERRRRVYPKTLDIWNYYIVRVRNAPRGNLEKGSM